MKNKGFTLVELLAVIVILAIIMIIAIPSVLNTMDVARRKSFMTFVEKVYTIAQKQYVEDTSFNGVSKKVDSLVVYNVTKDMGMSSTGEYKGYVLVNPHMNSTDYYIYVWDNDFFIGFCPSIEGMPEVNDLVKDNKVTWIDSNGVEVVVDSSTYHPWNKQDETYIHARGNIENEYFFGYNIDNFDDNSVFCFIKFYWKPIGTDDTGTTPIYDNNGEFLGNRVGSEVVTETALASCMNPGVPK